MATKNFEEMSLDELTAHKTSIKQKINELRKEAQAANEIQSGLIQEQHVAEARRSMQEWAGKNGKTLDQAIEYWEGRLTPNGDPGRWVQSMLLQGKSGKVMR